MDATARQDADLATGDNANQRQTLDDWLQSRSDRDHPVRAKKRHQSEMGNTGQLALDLHGSSGKADRENSIRLFLVLAGGKTRSAQKLEHRIPTVRFQEIDRIRKLQGRRHIRTWDRRHGE